MDFIPAQCAAKSLGPANQLVNLLIQTLLTSYCDISTPGWPRDCNAVDGEYFDYIVVGAGGGGSVVAGRLSENPNVRVLVLEAGGDPPTESEIPLLFFTMESTKYDWGYCANVSTACLASTQKCCHWPRGKMLGGSTALNHLAYLRGNKKNYDDWASMGNTDWDFEHVLKYFKRYEGNRDCIIARNKYYHNTTGPLDVKFLYRKRAEQIFYRAAIEQGYETLLDINADKAVGWNRMQGYVYDGVRQSAAKAFLIPAANRPNLCVRKNAQAYKILFNENKRAIGVKYDLNGTHFTAYARQEVVLSGGIVGSAQLLLLSGIGPKKQLDKFNIETISDLPVGKHLINQVGCLTFFKFKAKLPPPTEELDDIYDFFIHRTGYYSSSSGAEIIGFTNVLNNSRYPNIRFTTFYTRRNASSALALFLQLNNFPADIIAKLEEVNAEYAIGLVAVVVNQPKSVGEITLQSASYKDHPRIDPNYLGDPDDLRVMVKGLKRIVSMEKTKIFKKHEGEFIQVPICSQYEFRSDSYWECYARYMSITFFHPVGTSKMGPKGDPTSVVSQKLLVRGVKGLRQVDAGVCPYIPFGSTTAPVLMIGEKGAELIKESYSKKRS